MDLVAAAEQARRVLDKYGLRDWQFRYDRSRRRFGACHYTTRTISLSRELTSLNGEEVVADVLLHEVAHALAGHAAGHGRRWRQVAASLGIDPRRRLDPETLAMPPPRFEGTCPSCGQTIRRHRRDKVACRQCCARHGRRFSSRYLFQWREADERAGLPAGEDAVGGGVVAA